MTQKYVIYNGDSKVFESVDAIEALDWAFRHPSTRMESVYTTDLTFLIHKESTVADKNTGEKTHV